ncbi:MAG: lipoate--protein ligase family protein [Verrucomicrobiota bacterium]
MKFLDLTLPTPAENLAADEALLDYCEHAGGGEFLRVWESPEYFVVVGYANKVNVEVNREACRTRQIPVFRRCSGGGTVVQGPGCLNYSLVLDVSGNDSLQTITGTNRFIMERQRDLFLGCTEKEVEIEGHTDLVMGVLKFSGNAQRRRKNFILFHGAFLLDFDLPLIEALLKMPSKQPPYRKNRLHANFLTNLHWPASQLKNALRQSWKALEIASAIPQIPDTLRAKYLREDWNLKF